MHEGVTGTDEGVTVRRAPGQVLQLTGLGDGHTLSQPHIHSSTPMAVLELKSTF